MYILHEVFIVANKLRVCVSHIEAWTKIACDCVYIHEIEYLYAISYILCIIKGTALHFYVCELFGCYFSL